MNEDPLVVVEEEYAAVIELLATALRSGPEIQVDDVDLPVGLAAAGWCFRCARTAQAVVTLHRAGLGHEAAPLVRTLLEHSVSLQWLVERRDGAVAAVEYGHRRFQHLAREATVKGGWDLGDVPDELPPSHHDLDRPEAWDELSNFETMLIGLDRQDLHAIYRLECQYAHATYLSGAAYVDFDRFDRGEPGCRWEPAVEGMTLHVTATLLASALDVLRRVVSAPEIDATVDSARDVLRLGGEHGDGCRA